MLQAIERYMKQAIVDKVSSVSSSALVSSLVSDQVAAWPVRVLNKVSLWFSQMKHSKNPYQECFIRAALQQEVKNVQCSCLKGFGNQKAMFYV